MNKKPRLLVLTSTYPRWANDPEPGFVHELSRRLVSTFDVTVLCPAAPGTQTAEKMDGVAVMRYRYAPARLQTLVNDGGMVTNLKRSPWKVLLLPGFFLAQLLAVRRQVRRLRPHVIHAHWLIPQGFVLALLAAFNRDFPPFVVTSHGSDLFALKARPWLWMKRFVGGRAAAIALVSNAMSQELHKQKIRCAHVGIEPMGVGLETKFVPNPKIRRSEKALLFVGRLVESKGLKYLIRALPEIREKEPAVRLEVVGFGPEKGRLKRQVEGLGLTDHVRFLGAVPQNHLPDMYRRAALFVGPFLEEGLGLVTVEAIGCGCPVVVSDLPAVRDVIEEAPMKAPAADSKTLAARILSILEMPAPERQVMTERARLRLHDRFSWAARAGSYSALLKKVARSNP